MRSRQLLTSSPSTLAPRRKRTMAIRTKTTALRSARSCSSDVVRRFTENGAAAPFSLTSVTSSRALAISSVNPSTHGQASAASHKGLQMTRLLHLIDDALESRYVRLFKPGVALIWCVDGGSRFVLPDTSAVRRRKDGDDSARVSAHDRVETAAAVYGQHGISVD